MNELSKETNEIINEIDTGKLDNPVLISGIISTGCSFNNNIMHTGDIIIDDVFLDNMYNIGDKCIADESTLLTKLLYNINNGISEYFYSNEKNELSRANTYINNVVVNDEGMIIGTKMSSLKGKNIAKCSEKSISAYVILKYLYDAKKISVKPKLILSKMGVDPDNLERHAFLTLERNVEEYPKYLLWDIENPTTVMDSNNQKQIFIGLYGLTDKENKSIEEGSQCSPISLYETCGYHDVGEPRIYGTKIKKGDFGGQSNS